MLGKIFLFGFTAFLLSAQQESSSALNEVIGKITLQEQKLLARLLEYRPLAETYIQVMAPAGEDELAVKQDHYFLGKVNLGKGVELVSFAETTKESKGWFSSLFSREFRFLPRGFAQMALIDNAGLDRSRFDFTYVRREFLGEVRCLVFDLTPRKDAGAGRFKGRIWVEDQDFNVVRFSGTYTVKNKVQEYFHFNSWRVHTEAGLWLPAVVYVEELDRDSPVADKLMFKAKVNIWGYQPQRSDRTDEFTAIVVEAAQANDASAPPPSVDGVQGWQRQAEVNIIERMEKAGLLSPPGEVEKVLETVVNNLLVTNNLPDPGIKCRVMLTTPLESFAVNNTIVLSRGLVDVLPDEASLAMMLSRELAHVLLGHPLDTKYAFNDRIMIEDDEILKRFQFRREPRQLEEADAKAIELLRNSPYKDKLGGPGLFLRAVFLTARKMPQLFQPQIGNRVPQSDGLARLQPISDAAPVLLPDDLDQIAALRLGSRIMLDPWSNSILLNKTPTPKLTSPREKMPFEVAPLMLPLVRRTDVTRRPSAPPADPSRASTPAEPAMRK